MSDATMPATGSATPALSIVIPAKNEAGNVGPLIDEIAAAIGERWTFEIICVNDGSRDGTEAEINALLPARPWLRHLKHTVSCGKSAALRSGTIAARAPVIVTFDGDGQNDPKFLAEMVAPLLGQSGRVALVAGQRIDRQSSDSKAKKLQSRIANEFRGMMLKDGTRDTACGLKAFRRDVFLLLPYFDGLHRFLPALVRREGYDVAFVDVMDRPRVHGTSHYGMMDRLVAGLMDLGGVWWLIHRCKYIPACTEVKRDAG